MVFDCCGNGPGWLSSRLRGDLRPLRRDPEPAFMTTVYSLQNYALLFRRNISSTRPAESSSRIRRSRTYLDDKKSS
jgi:hypothetical protein